MTPGRDPALLDPLETVLRLRRRRGALAVALASALVVSAGLLLAKVLGRSGVAVANPVPLALLAGAVVAVAGLAFVWRRSRPAWEIAFDVDRRAGLGQRYGTAVEGGTGAEGAVALALRRAGIEDAAGLDPARLVPLATRPLVGGGVALALIWTMLLLLPPPAETGSGPPEVAGTAGEEDALVDTAREVARLLAEDAARRDDAYLAAIARSLEERLAATEDLPRLREDLAAHLDLAARAYGERPPEWLGNAMADRVAETQALLEEMRERQAARSAGPGMTGLSPLEREYGEGAVVVDADQRRSSLPGATPPPEAELVPVDGAQVGLVGDGVRRLEFPDRTFAGGIPIGAALQSGKGLSNAAGQGTQPLERDDAFAGIASAAGEDMIVTATPEAGGRRIRIELVPETGAMVPGGAAGTLADAATPLTLAPAQRQFVPADRREVTARYFARAPQ